MSPARADFRSSPTPAPSIAPLAVSPQVAGDLLGIRMTRVYALMRDGELLSFRSGRSRRIVMQSIHDYVARRLAEAATHGWSTWPHNPRARRQRREEPKRAPQGRRTDYDFAK